MVRKNRINTVEDLLKWEGLLCAEQKSALLAVERPKRVGWIRTPESLDGLTMEELATFWSVKDTPSLFDTTARILLHVRTAKHVPVLDMMGLVNFVSAELERINALWESIPSSRTPEEIQAGVSQLKFGVFGIIDWYARRMGITDHDVALKTPWVRVYQCMRNDAEEALYRKRLNEVISNKHKR